MNVLVVGAGYMAIEYCKVLRALDVKTTVVGNSQASADTFYENIGFLPLLGGLDNHIESLASDAFDAVIVASPEHLIGLHSQMLMEKGFRKILIEKPGGFDLGDIMAVHKSSKASQSEVFVAYNRRFFASTLAAKKIIAEDGEVQSFRFEFSEWGHVISGLEKAPGVKDQWFLNNSTHLIDLSYFLCGWPQELFSRAKGTTNWHKYGSVFTGAGTTTAGASFSYYANWASPGSFGLEINTNQRRLQFSPIEKLQQKLIGERSFSDVDIDYDLDERFKPGVFEMVRCFLFEPDNDGLITIEQQLINCNVYDAMRTGKADGI